MSPCVKETQIPEFLLTSKVFHFARGGSHWTIDREKPRHVAPMTKCVLVPVYICNVKCLREVGERN